MADGEDLMAQLPQRLSIRILELLDAETLFNCTEVNTAWNAITDHLQPRIWFEACLNAGIDVEEHTYHIAIVWKVFFLTMVERLRDMRISECYDTVYHTFEEPVRAISCHNDQVAVAFSGYVVIMDMMRSIDERAFTVLCDFESSFLRFDGESLVAASTDGHVSCWLIALGNLINQPIVFQGILLSIDVLVEFNFVVASVRRQNSITIVYIWKIFGERMSHIITANDIIHRVLLVPNPDSPADVYEKESFFLFGLAEGFVRLWIVNMRSRSFTAEILTTFIIPPDPNIRGDVDGTPPFGLLFDGTELFFTTQSLGRSPLIIRAWNYREETERILESDHPIINLLGVGNKYLVYKLRPTDAINDTVCAVDKITNAIVAHIGVTRFNSSNNQISLCNTSWMDGLNGENDNGFVLASLQEDPTEMDAVSFAPRHE